MAKDEINEETILEQRREEFYSQVSDCHLLDYSPVSIVNIGDCMYVETQGGISGDSYWAWSYQGSDYIQPYDSLTFFLNSSGSNSGPHITLTLFRAIAEGEAVITFSYCSNPRYEPEIVHEFEIQILYSDQDNS